MKQLLTFFILLVSTILGFTQEVTESEALTIAQNFYLLKESKIESFVEVSIKFKSSIDERGKIKGIKGRKFKDKTSFYAIDFEDGGYVLISGNKAEPPILAYSYEKNYISPEESDHYNYFIDLYDNLMDEKHNSKKEKSHEDWEYYLVGDFDILKSWA